MNLRIGLEGAFHDENRLIYLKEILRRNLRVCLV